MRLRLLVIWITLTALLQWSRAQEDNIQVESPEPDEEKPPEMQEDMNKTPGEDHTTTPLPVASNLEIIPPETGEPLMDTGDMPSNVATALPVAEPGEPLENTADMPSNGTQVEEMDHQQSGEHKKEEQHGMSTQDIPSDGSMISIKDPMSAEETAGTPSPPPHKEKPTTQEPKNPKEPPTTPEGDKSADYQDDGPVEDNGPKVEATPPVPTPVYRYQNCYSCLNCSATVKDDQKTICKGGAADQGGCYTMLLNDQKVLPSKRSYVKRGCSSELTDAFIRYCKENKELCLRCEANYCNVHDMTKLQLEAAGGAMSVSPRLLGLLLIGSTCLASYWRRQVFC